MNKYLLILIFVALTFASPAAAYLAYVSNEKAIQSPLSILINLTWSRRLKLEGVRAA